MEPRDLLKKLHPNQFSDSKVIDKIECPRELLDFHLSKLSEQNKHFDFEDFIRNLLEREICPNLIEETGPAGGGDGKVDTGNYPVSKDIQDYWWYGLNEKKDIIYGVPENNPFENISHRNIYSSGMIKCNHWDVAKWKGVVYLGDVINKEFIKIGFLFENEEME